MKSLKFWLILLIFATTVVAPAPGIFGHDNTLPSNSTTNAVNSTEVKTNGFITQPPANPNLNASAFVNRTITIKVSARTLVEDAMSLTIHDNKTKISYFNYTIPTFYQKHVDLAKFYVQYGSDVGILNANNTRTPYVLQGSELTTYFIPVMNGTKPADINNSKVYIHATLGTPDFFTWSAYNGEQRGTIKLPVRPLFFNLNVSAEAGIRLEGQNDKFSSDSVGQYQYTASNLVWRNLDYVKINATHKLVSGIDYALVIFDSTSPTQPKQGTTTPITYPSIDRTVRIDPFGKVYVAELITIKHIGAPLDPNRTGGYKKLYGVKGTTLFIPNNAVVTQVSDKLGSLNLGARNASTGYPDLKASAISGFNSLSVVFRDQLFGGDSYTFSVFYQFDSNKVITTSSSGLTLNTSLSSLFNATVERFTSTYKLPTSATLFSTTFDPVSQQAVFQVDVKTARPPLSLFRNVDFVIRGYNVSQFDNRDFQITFGYNRVALLLPILNLFFIFLVLILAYIGLYQLNKKWNEFSQTEGLVEETVIDVSREKIPVKELENFYNVFIEVKATTDRIDFIKQSVKKGKMKKREYNATMKSLNKKLKNLNEQLNAAVRASQPIGPKYKNLVNKVMDAHFNQLDVRTSMEKNEAKYLKKEIPKTVYMRLNSQYTEDIDKLEKVISKNMAEMNLLLTV